MKVVLSTMNARYTHSSLALSYLEEACYGLSAQIIKKEYTINEKVENIMADLYRIEPEVLCFSCYIWNIQPIMELCTDYKKVSPDCKIVLGGPEVSFDPIDLLNRYTCIDYVIRGEGEETLRELIYCLENRLVLSQVKGLSWRNDGICINNEDRLLIKDLAKVRNPYKQKEIIDDYKNRLLYYETSRGCPFNCSYCISSTFKGVRYFPMDRVKEDIALFIQRGIKKVKFVDRTFNANEKRALEIMEYIIEQNPGTTRFHFEICADILSDQMMVFLKEVPAGLFDFEIGVQSTCPETLAAVNRKSDWNRLSANIRKLKSYGNIHLHLDLIAGLPYEDYERFAISFNDIYKLKPHVIQLGFLKLLKGSPIYMQEAKHSYIHQDLPPYQVLTNAYMGYEDICKLKDIEEVVDRYYNGGYMKESLEYIVTNIYHDNAFKFWEDFSYSFRQKGLFELSLSRQAEYSKLLFFIKHYYSKHAAIIHELLKYDYLTHNHSYQLPAPMIRNQAEKAKEKHTDILKNEEFVYKYIPDMLGQTVRELKKYTHLEYLSYLPQRYGWIYEFCPLLFVYDKDHHKCIKIIAVEDNQIPNLSINL